MQLELDPPCPHQQLDEVPEQLLLPGELCRERIGPGTFIAGIFKGA